MVSKKYLKDYNVEKRTDEKGRVRSRAVYVGGYYSFAPPVSRADRLIILLLTILSDIAFIGVFMLRTQAARIWFVMLPFVLIMIPLYLLSIAAFSLMFAKEVMIRYDAERIVGRLSPASLISAALAAVSFAGFVISLLTSGGESFIDDVIFCILALVVAAGTGVVMMKFRRVKTVKTDKTIDLEEEREY